jgi:hypothetical protein
MANTTVTGATAAPKSLVSRAVGIITAPRATYESVVAHPRWLGMLALSAGGLGLLIGGFLLTKVGQEAWLDAALNSPFSGQPSEQAIQGMERMAPYVGYFTVVYMLVLVPIFMCIVSGILYAIFNAAMGGNATFKQVLDPVAAVHRSVELLSRHDDQRDHARGAVADAA